MVLLVTNINTITDMSQVTHFPVTNFMNEIKSTTQLEIKVTFFGFINTSTRMTDNFQYKKVSQNQT
jgi:hypothetical protein